MESRLVKSLETVKSLPEITLGKIVEQIEGESLLILCLISILPFMQPIPIPGLSSILGLIILMQGIGLMIWQKPLLTQKMKKVVISHDRFETIYTAAVKFSIFTSKLSAFKHPFARSRLSHIFCGLAIVISAAFLSLPLPLPLSNFIPALSIFLVCVGLLEEDLVLILIGQGITITIVWMILFSYHIIREQFLNWI